MQSAQKKGFQGKENNPSENPEKLNGKVRESRKALRRAIIKSKVSAWEELLVFLDADPWRRDCYQKLRNSGPPVCETLPPEVVDEIVDTLFPRHRTVIKKKVPDD